MILLCASAFSFFQMVFHDQPALADLDPSLGGRRVLLADRLDGKPLPADEAPWRLIVVGDQRPARSARQVVRIRVLAEPR